MRDPELAADDSGRAIIEVVFLAVLLLIPTLYIFIGVFRVQAATLAVSQAARDVGRLLETSDPPPSLADVTTVAQIALADQGLPRNALHLHTVAPGGECDTADDFVIDTRAGARYDVCVTATISLPGVPTVLTGSNNTVTGVYTVTIGEFRQSP